MKIFIKENKESARYISEIKAALQKAGHQVFQDSDFPDTKEGLQSCHVRLDLLPAGMANDKESIDRPFVRTEVDLRVRKMVQVIGHSSLPRRQIVADLGLRQQSRRNFIYNRNESKSKSDKFKKEISKNSRICCKFIWSFKFSFICYGYHC